MVVLLLLCLCCCVGPRGVGGWSVECDCGSSNYSTNSLLGDNIKLSPLHTLTQQRGLQVIIILLSCQPRVTVTSCFVYKVIRDL